MLHAYVLSQMMSLEHKQGIGARKAEIENITWEVKGLRLVAMMFGVETSIGLEVKPTRGELPTQCNLMQYVDAKHMKG